MNITKMKHYKIAIAGIVTGVILFTLTNPVKIVYSGNVGGSLQVW
jgi:hypothetical protein